MSYFCLIKISEIRDGKIIGNFTKNDSNYFRMCLKIYSQKFKASLVPI